MWNAKAAARPAGKLNKPACWCFFDPFCSGIVKKHALFSEKLNGSGMRLIDKLSSGRVAGADVARHRRHLMNPGKSATHMNTSPRIPPETIKQ